MYCCVSRAPYVRYCSLLLHNQAVYIADFYCMLLKAVKVSICRVLLWLLLMFYILLIACLCCSCSIDLFRGHVFVNNSRITIGVGHFECKIPINTHFYNSKLGFLEFKYACHYKYCLLKWYTRIRI